MWIGTGLSTCSAPSPPDTEYGRTEGSTRARRCGWRAVGHQPIEYQAGRLASTLTHTDLASVYSRIASNPISLP